MTESPAAHRRRVEQKGEIVRFTLGCMVERNEEVERQPKETRELSGAVRKSETVALRHPIMPVSDGLLRGFVRVDGF